MIPRKIHYCWYGPKQFGKMEQMCFETWKKHLPDYEIILWNEENSPFDIPFLSQAYNAKKYAFVADYFRFWALYKYGGIYLDTDMFVIKSFDELLNNECFTGFEENSKTIGYSIFGAKPNNEFIKYKLDLYSKLNFDINEMDKLCVPDSYEELNANQKISFESVKIYPANYFYPFPYSERHKPNTMEKYIKPETIAIHMWSWSWVSPWVHFKFRILKLYNSILNKVYK